jgi:hypothetical protein
LSSALKKKLDEEESPIKCSFKRGMQILPTPENVGKAPSLHPTYYQEGYRMKSCLAAARMTHVSIHCHRVALQQRAKKRIGKVEDCIVAKNEDLSLHLVSM